MLSIQNLSCEIGGKSILKNISFSVNENDFCMLMGPNGAGKTSLIKAIMQDYAYSGKAILLGKDLKGLTPAQRARLIGVLSQKNNDPQYPYSVLDIVSLGRYAYKKGIFSRLSNGDKEEIEKAMELTKITHLKNRSILTLSGGELQRVMLAKLFAQNPKLLILDEPLNHLDFNHQIKIFDILKNWSKEKGHSILAVAHDFNFAKAYATRALLLKEGQIFAQGKTADVLNSENLSYVFQADISGWIKKQLVLWV